MKFLINHIKKIAQLFIIIIEHLLVKLGKFFRYSVKHMI